MNGASVHRYSGADPLDEAEAPFLHAKARDGMLVVSCQLLSNLDSGEQEYFEILRLDSEKRGGFMGYLEEQYGAGDHLVVVLGRGESLLVPHSIVDGWWREYNPLAASEPEYVDAARVGAKGILRWFVRGYSR